MKREGVVKTADTSQLMQRLTKSRSAALAMGRLADQVFGDPPSSRHPVAIFGSVMETLTTYGWADTRLRGAVLCSVGLGLTTLLGAAIGGRSSALAISTWMTVGEAQLQRTALEIGELVRNGDLDAARKRCGEIVGRKTSELDESEICRAVVESVAENTADGVVGPLLYGALFGPTGALLYRAINTMDAMFGHRTPEFERFGWFAARIDDVANLPVSRLGALLVSLRCSRGQRQALRRAWSSARKHPSPNAGVIEAAFAVKLGVTLGGRNVYGDRVEERVLLGDGPAPSVEDIVGAVALSRKMTRDCLMVFASVEMVTLLMRNRWRSQGPIQQSEGEGSHD